jgi:hypothetical protein
MRDGIPGKLPVPRKYKEAVACADRPADRGTFKVSEKFAIALHEDLQKIFGHKAELKKLSSSNSPSLPGLEIDIGQHLEGSYRIDELLADVRKATLEGERADKAIHTALSIQIEDVLASRLRSIREHLAPEISPSEFKEIKLEIERATMALSPLSEAQSFLDGKRVATPISGDEDLRGPDAQK